MPIQASEPVAERPAADTDWRVPAARAREQWLSDVHGARHVESGPVGP